MIRRATLKDTAALIQLENASFTTDIISSASLRRLLKVESAEILVFEDENHIIGSLILLFRKNSKTARIYSLAVLQQHRRSGIAAHLYHAAEKSATKRSLENIILEVHPDNHAALRFYEKNGFQTFGRYSHFYECGSDAIRMKKKL
ncbi:MAG: N-acetyltransferase [Gammaproteobacteria bacterium]|nr:N-acetyltransferase [Gammaproteobacteria bacterium]